MSGTWCDSKRSTKTRDREGEIMVKYFKVSSLMKPEYFRLFLLGLLGITLLLVGTFLTNPKEASELTRDQSSLNFKGYENELAREIERVVSAINGAGKVRAAVTLESGPETFYAKNLIKSKNSQTETLGEAEVRESISENETIQPVMSRSSSSGDVLIPEKVVYPKIAGCLVVAEGASSSRVKRDIYEAVQVLLNIPIYKIVVLPMQGGN